MSQIVTGYAIAQAVPLGRLVLTLPAGRPLSRKGRKTLDLVIAAEADGFSDLAASSLEELERALGVTVDDRLIAGSLPDPRGIVPDDLDRLQLADAALRSETSPRAVRTQAKRTILAVKQRQQSRARRADEAEVERGIAETVQLRQARGELVHVGLGAGKRRASIVGGLELALEKGVLDLTSVSGLSLMRAAELYRDLYEVARGFRGPDKTEKYATAGVSGGFAAKSMTPQIMAAQEFRYLRDGMTKLQKDICNEVCGEDRTINSVAREWGKNPRTLEKALAEGLYRFGQNKDWW